MNQLQLFRILRHHRKLAEKRNFNFAQNRIAKYIVWASMTLLFLYLMGFAVMLALIANDDHSSTSVEIIFAAAPIILAIDFFIRFTIQQTPSQMVKPYVLLPIPRYTCINQFIGTTLLSGGNLIWFSMLVPYVLMSVLFSHGILTSIYVLLFFWLAIMANSQWYAIVRTLVNSTLRWWILPLFIYGLAFIPAFVKKGDGAKHFFDFYSSIGTAIDNHNILPLIGIAAILVIVIAINRKLQYVSVWRELAKTEQTHLHHISRFTFLDKYGETGHYLQLEIKTIIRNKNPRKSFIFATTIVLVFSLVISLTDIYNDAFMTNFWCLYNFVIYGAMMLVRIMCNEGNYIDCLMVRRENILSLLHAKYIFYSIMIIFPFLLMLPTVFTGKWSFLMLFSYAVFTCGFQYFILFQMAVYNKQALPLNTKFISRGNMENNYIQVIAEMVNMMVPVAFVSLLQAIMSPTLSYLVMLTIGLLFIATHRLWLRNIYNRMMRHHYAMIESFRSSR